MELLDHRFFGLSSSQEAIRDCELLRKTFDNEGAEKKDGEFVRRSQEMSTVVVQFRHGAFARFCLVSTISTLLEHFSQQELLQKQL